MKLRVSPQGPNPGVYEIMLRDNGGIDPSTIARAYVRIKPQPIENRVYLDTNKIILPASPAGYEQGVVLEIGDGVGPFLCDDESGGLCWTEERNLTYVSPQSSAETGSELFVIDEKNTPDETDDESFRVPVEIFRPGLAVIAVGGGHPKDTASCDPDISLDIPLMYAGAHAHQMLQGWGFHFEDIYFLYPSTADSLDDFPDKPGGTVIPLIKSIWQDARSMRSQLHYAITQWTITRGAGPDHKYPLYIFLMDHGRDGDGDFVFYNTTPADCNSGCDCSSLPDDQTDPPPNPDAGGWTLSYENLEAWIEEYQNATQGARVVLLNDSCYSGHYIGGVGTGYHSDGERIVMSSTPPPDPGIMGGSKGQISLTRYFLNALKNDITASGEDFEGCSSLWSQDVFGAWRTARCLLERAARPHPNWTIREMKRHPLDLPVS